MKLILESIYLIKMSLYNCTFTVEVTHCEYVNYKCSEMFYCCIRHAYSLYTTLKYHIVLDL